MKPAKLKMNFNKERKVLKDIIPLSTPLVLYLELSGYCNLKCQFCPQGVRNDELIKDILSPNLLIKIVGDLKKFDMKLSLLRICGDGEPLINKNAANMLQCIYENGITDRIELVTNGILLKKNLSEEIVKYVDQIIISVEGLDQEDYICYAGTKIDYQDFIDNIKYLHEISGENCNIHVKIHSNAVQTQERRERFFNIFENICDTISIENLVDLWPAMQINLNLSNNFRFINEDGNVWINNQQRRKVNVCTQIFKSLQIYANGDVTPCCADWKRYNLIGNVNNMSLKEIWDGDGICELQKHHLTNKKGILTPCKDCSLNDLSETDYIDNDVDEILRRLK